MSGSTTDGRDFDDSATEHTTALDSSQSDWTRFINPRMISADGVDARKPKKQRERAWALLEKEVVEAQRVIHRLRQRQNLMQPVFLLPPEILSRIFMILNEENQPNGLRHISLTISYVCRIWRSTALGCASLWTQVPLDLGEQCAQAFAARSKAVDLEMPPMRAFSPSSWRYNFLERYLPRLRNLQIMGVEDSHVAAAFSVLASDIPKRLDVFMLFAQYPSAITVQPDYVETLRRIRNLHVVGMLGIPLPWNAYPWTRLRELNITALSPNPAQANLALLVASLATAASLETLHLIMEKCSFAFNVYPLDPETAQLPRLRSYKFHGYVDDFQRLSNAIRMPPSARLDISLLSTEFLAADASVVSSLLRAHSGYEPQQPELHLRIMRLSAMRAESWIRFVGSRSYDDGPHIAITFRLFDSTAHILASQLAGLCQNVELKALRQLHVAIGDEEDENELPLVWDEDTWRAVFLPARGVECLHVHKGDHDSLFDALHGQGETQSGILFPSLRHVYLSGFHEPSFVYSDSDSLSAWVEDRAQDACIETLCIVESTICARTIKELRAIPGLRLEWDGIHGDLPEEDEEQDGE